MTVTDLLSRATSRELTEWKAYFFIESENTKRRELAAKAKAGVANRKGRR